MDGLYDEHQQMLQQIEDEVNLALETYLKSILFILFFRQLIRFAHPAVFIWVVMNTMSVSVPIPVSVLAVCLCLRDRFF
jgi:hypothetical protein